MPARGEPVRTPTGAPGEPRRGGVAARGGRLADPVRNHPGDGAGGRLADPLSNHPGDEAGEGFADPEGMRDPGDRAGGRLADPDPVRGSADGLVERVVLRPPVGAELRACRMLLPELGDAAMPWDSPLIALTERPYQVVGALATARLRHVDGRPRLRLALQVVPPCRRAGVASALLARLAAQAQAEGTGALLAWLDDPEHSPSRAFLQARGFRTWDTETVFEASLERLIERLRRLHTWLAARGSIPAQARFVPLAEAPLDEAAALYAENIGGGRAAARRRLLVLARGPQAQAQSVLMVGDRLVGLQLGGLSNGYCHVDAKVVAPEFRAARTGLAWADVALMMHRAEWARDHGHAVCRFSCMSRNVHTNKLARHAQARVARVMEIHRLGLEPTAQASPPTPA